MTDNNIYNKFQERCFGAAIAFIIVYAYIIPYYLISKNLHFLSIASFCITIAAVLFPLSKSNKILVFIVIFISFATFFYQFFVL